MKMARASEQDLDCAASVASILESLIGGYMPDCLSENPDDIEWFDIDDGDACKKVLHKLIDEARKGSMQRVTFGMLVLLDPRNELLDPNDDCLALHPKLVGLLNNLAPTP